MCMIDCAIFHRIVPNFAIHILTTYIFYDRGGGVEEEEETEREEGTR